MKLRVVVEATNGGSLVLSGDAGSRSVTPSAGQEFYVEGDSISVSGSDNPFPEKSGVGSPVSSGSHPGSVEPGEGDLTNGPAGSKSSDEGLG